MKQNDVVRRALERLLALRDALKGVDELDHYQTLAALETLDDVEAWLRSLDV